MTLAADFPSSTDLFRHDWTIDEVAALHQLPLLELLSRANVVHATYNDPTDLQRASLLSIKTGGCPEDCAYCPQSAHHNSTGLRAGKLMDLQKVIAAAIAAKSAGATRFCMGAAWREVRDGRDFDAVIEMVKGVRQLGLEACATLGMLNGDQARRLADAGLTAYNHNLDTSIDYYGSIVSTRRYEDRLRTLRTVRDNGIHVCCGGIIGMGETVLDRISLIQILANFSPHPESVPINILVPVKGTPLEHSPPIDVLEIIRMIATVRLTMPASRIRLSAGRSGLSRETQLLAMLAGVNSIFYGTELLTTPNNSPAEDDHLLNALS